MKGPIDFFLIPIVDTVYYNVVKMATQSNLHLKEIAEEESIEYKTCESRVTYGALKMGISGGRSGLKSAYIEYLEDWINQRGMK